MFFLYSVEDLEFTSWMVNLAAAMTGILLWVLLNQSRKIYVGMGMGIIAAGVFLLLAANRSLREKFFDIFRGVWGNLQEGPAEVTGAGILLAIFLVWTGFFIEFVLHAHGILYLAITFLLLLAPLLGHTPGSRSVFLLTAFQLVFWTMTGVRKLASKNKDLLKNKISIGVFLGFAGIFSIAFLIVSFQEEGLYQAAYGAEGVLQRTVKQITGLDLNASDGRVSRGNLYPTDREQLELVTEEMPTETLYLKGFSVTNRLPLYVETGAALQYRSHKEEGNYGGPGYDYSDKHKMFSLNIPVNLLYRFNVTDDFSVSPYFGLDFRINLTGKYSWETGMGQYNEPQGEDLNLFDEDEMGKDGVWKRFQAGWHIGTNFTYKKVSLGISYGQDFNEIVEDCKLSTTTVTLGFNF